MTKTVPANYIGEPSLGYVLLAIPSVDMKKRITNLLNELSRELPEILWPMPPEQLHITLCEIIQPKDYAQDKETLFKSRREQYENVPAAILSTLPKFAITFNTIEVSPQAIIVKTSDSIAFNSIRANLVKAMRLPDETRTPPDITHISIARYLKAVELERVQEIVAKHNLVVKEEITEFKLLRITISPLQEFEILKTFSLAVDR